MTWRALPISPYNEQVADVYLPVLFVATERHTTLREGHSEHAPDCYWSMTDLQCQCSYRREGSVRDSASVECLFSIRVTRHDPISTWEINV